MRIEIRDTGRTLAGAGNVGSVKRADVDLHFTTGPLAGLRLLGCAIWERRERGEPVLRVTVPARTYKRNGDTFSYAILRPSNVDGVPDGGMARYTTLVVNAYRTFLATTAPGTASGLVDVPDEDTARTDGGTR